LATPEFAVQKFSQSVYLVNIVTTQISQYVGKISAANSGDPNLIRDKSPRKTASLNYAELSSEQES
jgi:hypothetical protein